MLTDLYNQLSPLELTGGKRNNIQADMSKPPDVWFEPKIIFEVLTADLTLSPIYTAAKGLVSERSECGVSSATSF
jgi:DNA ligase-1